MINKLQMAFEIIGFGISIIYSFVFYYSLVTTDVVSSNLDQDEVYNIIW